MKEQENSVSQYTAPVQTEPNAKVELLSAERVSEGAPDVSVGNRRSWEQFMLRPHSVDVDFWYESGKTWLPLDTREVVSLHIMADTNCPRNQW